MKFKHIFLLSALALSLFSCTSVSDTTNPGDNTNEEKPGDDNNNEKPGDDNNGEEKPGDDNNNEKPGDENNGEETTGDWTEEEKSLMKKYLNGEVLPYFHLEGCSLYYDEMIETVTYSGGKGTSLDTAKYAKILENNGFIIDEDNSDSTIGCYYFTKQFDLFDFCVQVYNLDENYDCVESGDFYIDAYILTYSETWDADLIETYFPGTKDNLIPFEDAYLYYFDEEYAEYGFLTVACFTEIETPSLTYFETLKNSNKYSVSYSEEEECYYALALDKTHNLCFYDSIGDGALFVIITDGSYEEEAPVSTNTITFENESCLKTKTEALAIWECEAGTFKVEKGSSSINVGNFTYYSNPLRIYTGQTITISANEDYNVSSVEIDINKSASSLDVSWSGATIVIDGNKATLTFDENSSTASATLNNKVRLNSVTFK